MKYQIGQVLEDGYIFAGIMYDHENDKDYGLAIAPKDQPEEMNWRDAVKLSIPTKKECNLISANLGHLFDISNWYWSSTEYSNGGSWVQRFNDGYQNYNLKTNGCRVRCVRRLDLSSFDSSNKDAASAEYERILKEVEEALEFVSMPITSNNPTVEGLLETFNVDRERVDQALEKLREFRGEHE